MGGRISQGAMYWGGGGGGGGYCYDFGDLALLIPMVTIKCLQETKLSHQGHPFTS